MISGCLDDQTSAEDKKSFSNKQMGAMTSTLLKVLDKYKYNITIGDLMIQMNKILLDGKYSQIPVFSSNKTLSLKKIFAENSSLLNNPQIKNIEEKFDTNAIYKRNMSKHFDVKNNSQIVDDNFDTIIKHKIEKYVSQSLKKNNVKSKIISEIKNIIEKHKKHTKKNSHSV
jgi:hypothetical protein